MPWRSADRRLAMTGHPDLFWLLMSSLAIASAIILLLRGLG
jgi:hypothetical protein